MNPQGSLPGCRASLYSRREEQGNSGSSREKKKGLPHEKYKYFRNMNILMQQPLNNFQGFNSVFRRNIILQP